MRDRRPGGTTTLTAAPSAGLTAPPPAFRALSARLGADPLQIQGPGGNTSIKRDGTMWIKASGTELADAETSDVFVAVDVARARAEVGAGPAMDGPPEGDGTCRAALIGGGDLRPSIETTFHAALDAAVVLHTHSVGTLAHAVSAADTRAALAKLEGMGAVAVPYAKPGLPLTRAILRGARPDTRVMVLRNHGLLIAADTVAEADTRIAEVERRLALPASDVPAPGASFDAPPRWHALPWAAALANPALAHALTGTLYPDHAVFLGPGVGVIDDVDGAARLDPSVRLAVLPGRGAMLRDDADETAHKMVRCLLDVALRAPPEWGAEPIGVAAEAELLDWDAETYRQTGVRLKAALPARAFAR